MFLIRIRDRWLGDETVVAEVIAEVALTDIRSRARGDVDHSARELAVARLEAVRNQLEPIDCVLAERDRDAAVVGIDIARTIDSESGPLGPRAAHPSIRGSRQEGHQNGKVAIRVGNVLSILMG